MKSGMYFMFAAAALAGVSLSACGKQSPPTVDQSSSQPPAPALPAAAIAAQDEVNEYFYRQVMSRLAPCWKSLKGMGVVEFKYSFRPGSKQWLSDKVTVENTTLAAEQATAATRCMEEAVKGTSLLSKSEIGTAPGLSVYWEWPVPLPEPTLIAIPLRISTGGGGGDRVCNKCMPEACPDDHCPKRDQCSGHTTCTVTNSSDGTAQCNFLKSDVCTQGHYGSSGNRMFIY